MSWEVGRETEEGGVCEIIPDLFTRGCGAGRVRRLENCNPFLSFETLQTPRLHGEA